MTRSKNQLTPFSVAIQRPIAVSMFFLAIAFLGVFSWLKIPVELLPSFRGEQLFVNYYLPGAEPETIEREILIPLESRVKQLAGVTKTWGEISGSTGSLNIEFESGSNHRIRELELRQIAAELARTQPEGTRVRVSSQDTSAISRFVMSIQILGGDDSNALRDLVEERIQPRMESVEGVSRVLIFGGASKELTVSLYADRCAKYGVKMSDATAALHRSVDELIYVGGKEVNQQRISVVVDGTPNNIASLETIQIVPHLPVLLRHVADVEISTAPQKSVSRVNGQASVSVIVFQDQGANLVQLGQRLQVKIKQLKEEFNRYSIDLVTSFDASQKVQEQLEHLKKLAASGFLIALLILFLFLKQIRAVAVVAIAVPMSLLTAGALLYLAGYSLNLITLFGLVIGVGMLVDNSIVVYEAVQRNLERGANPDVAAIDGIRLTIRAIITASATNAIVFLPLIFLKDIPITIKLVMANIVPAILFPLAASLLVAIGLVPLLARRLAAPAALRRIRSNSERRRLFNGKLQPQMAREIFSGMLKVALRRPAPWLLGSIVVILLTLVIALPWVLVQSIAQLPAEADQVRVEVEFDGGGSLEAADLVFDRLEKSVLQMDGVERVESNYQEWQGSITIHLLPLSSRPASINAAKVRQAVSAAVEGMNNIQLRPLSANSNGVNSVGGTGVAGEDVPQIAISGPNMAQLNRLAENIEQMLKEIPEISDVSVNRKKSLEELRVSTNLSSVVAHRLSSEDVLESLIGIGREGSRLTVGFELSSGLEIPIVIRRVNLRESKAQERINNLPILTKHGTLSLSELIDTEQGVSPIAIVHQNGRRELRVNYRLNESSPKIGPERLALEQQIETLIQSIHRPEGYTIESTGGGRTTDWFKVVVIPIILLLYALLAMSFESFTLPILILITVPLTVFGAVWALVISGLGADIMAAVGAVVLLGLSVNPAILLVDRMQQKLRSSHCSGGTAAMTAVRERVRPVLMTSCTTAAGLWPLALAKGQELELWPPFAVVVMGGLFASTILTLLVIPIGFVVLSKIDKAISHLGPWKLILWIVATTIVMVPLIATDLLASLSWQLTAGCFTSGILFWLTIKLFSPKPALELDTEQMVLETRYLSKIYGQPGPVGKAWYRWSEFSRQNQIYDVAILKERILIWVVLLIGSSYLAYELQSVFWRVCFSYLTGAFLTYLIIEIRQRYTVSSDSRNTQKDTEFNRMIFRITPWGIFVLLATQYTLLPIMDNQQPQLPLIVLILIALTTILVQVGRYFAVLLNEGSIGLKVESGRLKGIGFKWRRFCQVLFSWELKPKEFKALSSVSFRAESSMIGVLGHNGAGKTTLFRLIASVLDSSAGTIHYAGVEKRKIGKKLAGLIGYLPQEFGLPGHLTGKEYLHYFALLYEIGNKSERKKRVEQLLIEVGLQDKQNDKISDYSGGMRQRVAVARALLREPPIILVDEPTAGLDPRERIRFRNLLSKLSKGRVVLFSTHIVEDVAASCGRVLVLKAGSIIFDSTPEELARLAENKIWQVKLHQHEIDNFQQHHKVINHIPEQGEMVNLRVLSTRKPHDLAQAVESTLEDGYFQLFHGETINED